MNGGLFGDSGLTDGKFYILLQPLLVQMKPADNTASGVHRQFSCREYVLPSPLFGCVGIFPVPRRGQVNRPVTHGQVLIVTLPNRFKIIFQPGMEKFRQKCYPIFVSFSRPNNKGLISKIQILNPKSYTFYNPNTCGINQSQRQFTLWIDILEQPLNFRMR